MATLKIATTLPIKSPPNDFYQLFKKNPDFFVGICANVTAGDRKKNSTKWTYNFEGGIETFTEMKEFDEANKTVTHFGSEGDVFKYYKIFKGIYQVRSNEDNQGATVHVTIEYEKLNDTMPTPEKYLKMLVRFANDMDAYLSKA